MSISSSIASPIARPIVGADGGGPNNAIRFNGGYVIFTGGYVLFADPE